MSRAFYISTEKTAGTPRLSQLTPQTPTYPSSGKKAVGIIKLYQSRRFYIADGLVRLGVHQLHHHDDARSVLAELGVNFQS